MLLWNWILEHVFINLDYITRVNYVYARYSPIGILKQWSFLFFPNLLSMITALLVDHWSLLVYMRLLGHLIEKGRQLLELFLLALGSLNLLFMTRRVHTIEHFTFSQASPAFPQSLRINEINYGMPCKKLCHNSLFPYWYLIYIAVLKKYNETLKFCRTCLAFDKVTCYLEKGFSRLLLWDTN